ncbi:MAG: carbohydrate kinase family protein [Candidatus Acidiferrum sp.]
MTSQVKIGISVVGELNLDLILYSLPGHFEPDREYLASNLSLTLGSSSAIFAHNFALLGNRVGFHSAVGDDPLGRLCLERLAESGVNVSAVRNLRAKQTGLSVILPQPGKRFILTYPGIMAEMRFEDLDLARVLDARHLHLSSYFLQRALRPRVPYLFRLAKEAGLSTSMDTNDDPDDRWERDVLEVLPWLDVLLPNEYEACRLARTDDSMMALDFLATRVPLVVMKRGEKGALARRGPKILEALPPRVAAVDTIGAGDSFDAGFLHQFIRGAKIEECLRYGNLTGAFSTTRSGGTEAFRETKHRESFLAQ